MSCRGQPQLDIWLNLVEASGSTGQVSGVGWSELEEDTGDRTAAVITGMRVRRELSMQWKLPNEPLKLRAQLQGDQLVGEMDSPWDDEAPACTMRLDR